MIIWMHDGVIPLLASQDLNGPVGDDLIGIHVGRGSRAALDGIHDKLVVKLTGDNLVTCLKDGLPDVLIQHIGRHIRHGSGFFDLCQVVDEYRVKGPSGDVKIVLCPQGLHPIVGFCGDFQRSYGIRFDSCVHNTPLFNIFIAVDWSIARK